MKKLFIIALTLTFAVSCNVKELQPAFIKAPIFYGQIESESFSKTALSVDSDGVGTILWKPSDNINVFFGARSVKYSSNNSEEAIKVSFETKDVITDVDAESNNNWGLYPYNSEAECDGLSVTTTIPNIQKCADYTFGTDLFPMIAHTTSNNLHFLNICGGIKFSLSRDDVKSVTFKGNNDEDIAGKVKVSINDDGKPKTSIISGEKQITITPKSGTTFKQNTNYYIVMPPVVLANGFTMTFETETGVGTFIYNENPVVIKRSIFSVKEKIDTYASYKLSDNVVDMGLSVLWASCNIGATKSEEYGDYYAWGEIESKSNYDWSTYKWCNGTSTTLTKYNYNPSNGAVDNNYSLDMDDDAAHIKLGGKWRIPTKEDFDELLENCTYHWTTQNDVYGLSVTSEINGSTIFLPAAGDYVGMNNSNIGSSGDYWTSSLDLENSKYAYRPAFDSKGVNGGYGGRHIGRPIRPVYGDIATCIYLNKTSLTLYPGDVAQLTGIIAPKNGSEEELIWSSSDSSVATVSSSGIVTALSKGSAIISVSWAKDSNIKKDCQVSVLPEPLTFTSEGTSKIALKWNDNTTSILYHGTPNSIKLEYRIVPNQWQTYVKDKQIAINDGQSVQFRATDEGNTSFSKGEQNAFTRGTKEGYYYFANSGSGKLEVSGNIMSLLDNKMQSLTIPCVGCFKGLFEGLTSLISASKLELPATTLKGGCYAAMFYGCANLLTTPDLPATVLTNNCYQQMFVGCQNIVNAPNLPSTKIADYCYQAMFSGCSSLKNAPELPAKKLASTCYATMFYGCSSLTKIPNLPATIMEEYCYNKMFQKCDGLKTVSNLSAVTLAEGCYYNMFADCSNLTTAPDLPATVMSKSCYQEMFARCTSLVIAPDLPATTLAESCYAHMFDGCTSLEKMPSLTATTVAKSCCAYMFQNCSKIIILSALPAKTLAESCYAHMFQDCSSLDYAMPLPASTLAPRCYEDMFSGCKNLQYAPNLLAKKLEPRCYASMFRACGKLNQIKMLATDISASQCLSEWTLGVADRGTITISSAANYNRYKHPELVPEGWNVQLQ